MTDKDPKDMTASELLRKADSHPCSMCHLVMAGEESCATTVCESWAYRLADKVDAELAQATAYGISEGFNSSLRAGAELWAKANGWPGFRDGEDFGAWLDRCAIPRPRFEDGEPVQVGDETAWGTVSGIRVYAGGEWNMCFEEADCYGEAGDRDERVAGLPPEVLLADGLPAKVGETVYQIGDGARATVSGIENGAVFVHWDDPTRRDCWPDPFEFTHTPPDTQERIDEDKHKIASAYWRCESEFCSNCPSKIDGMSPREYYDVCICDVAQGMDIARRQRELDKRKGGAE